MIGQIHDVDIKLLRVFVAVVKAGGFSSAQAELNTSQAFISTQMKSLEERLGTRLCQRGQAGFKLTDAGKAVLESTERLFESLETFRKEAAVAVDPLAGSIKLGVIDQLITCSDCKISEAIEAFEPVAPMATIEISVVPPLELENSLLDGQIEFAYGIFHHKIGALEYKAIGKETHEIYCASGHPLFSKKNQLITDEDVAACAYVGWDYLESGELLDATFARQLRAASPYVEAVLHYILSNRYIGYLPTHVGKSWVDAGKLRSVRPADFRRTVDIELVTKRGVELSSIASKFQKVLLKSHRQIV